MAATVSAVVALAACGGGKDQPKIPDADHAIVARPGIDPARQAPAAEVDGAVAGGTLTILSAQGLNTMDPTEAYYTNTVSILSGLVTRSLTQYVYDPEQDTTVLVPDIATDVGTPNGDYTEWTFTIRPGVKFEDGTEVTAEDVAYGIMRSFDRDTFPEGPSYSNDYFLHGDTYDGPYRTGTVYDGIVVDGPTLTLKMARPFPDMPYWAAFPAMGPIPDRGRDRPADYKLHPLATGPYKFGPYHPGESLTLVRNDQWDPDTDPGRHQYVDEFHFDFHTPGRQIDAALLADAGDAQTTLTIDNVLPADFATAQADAPDRLVTGLAPCTSSLAPDYREIDEIQVRQALGYAFPYEDFWRAIGEIPGVTALPGTSILPPGTPGRLDYNPLSTEPGQTDPEKARALLRDAGYQPGEYRIDLAYQEDDPFSVDSTAALARGLEVGGFTVTLHPQPNFLAYLAVLEDPTAPVNVRWLGWCSDWPSGTSWFPPLFSSTPTVNYAHFQEDWMDNEIERILQLPLEEQPGAWGALDKLLMTDYYPVIVNSYGGVALLRGSRVGSLSVDGVSGMPTWKDIYVVP